MNKIEKTNQLKKKEEKAELLARKSEELESTYSQELDTNPKYSLEVDPTNMYGMSDTQKRFVKAYVDYKNVPQAAMFAEIQPDEAQMYLIAYSSQQEIRRINLAMYHRQFRNRLLNLSEIGGYLTSLLTGENVPEADKPTTVNDKLKIVQMLIDLNKIKIEAMENPDMLMHKSVETELKDLSINTIKKLIATSEEKVSIIADGTPEENAYLSTLPNHDLLEIIKMNGEKK